MTGDVIFTITSEELIARGVSVQPRIWIAKVSEPEQPKKTDWRTVYKNGVVYNRVRNLLIAQMAKTFKEERKPTLILVHRIYHGELLIDLLKHASVRAEFIRGSVSQENREASLRRLWSGRSDAIVAIASTLGEGADLPALRAIINATGTTGGGDTADGETGRNTIQILGRGLRSADGKRYVDYCDFADSGHADLAEASADRISTLAQQGFGKYVNYWENYSGVV
jgi:superfamily II DNA or RNA helicase